MWHLRRWLQYWQLRTWINDNLCTWQLIVTLDTIHNSCNVYGLNGGGKDEKSVREPPTNCIFRKCTNTIIPSYIFKCTRLIYIFYSFASLCSHWSYQRWSTPKFWTKSKVFLLIFVSCHLIILVLYNLIMSFDKSDLPDCRCRVEASLPVGGVPSPRNQRCFPASLSFPNLYIRCHVSWCDFQFYNILYFHDCSLPFSTFISEFYKSYLSSTFASPALSRTPFLYSSSSFYVLHCNKTINKSSMMRLQAG